MSRVATTKIEEKQVLGVLKSVCQNEPWFVIKFHVKNFSIKIIQMTLLGLEYLAVGPNRGRTRVHSVQKRYFELPNSEPEMVLQWLRTYFLSDLLDFRKNIKIPFEHPELALGMGNMKMLIKLIKSKFKTSLISQSLGRKCKYGIS